MSSKNKWEKNHLPPDLWDVTNGVIEIDHCLRKWRTEQDLNALQKAYELLKIYKSMVGENLSYAKRNLGC